MGLKTLVKVGDVTNLSDARYCAGMGVELIGFNLDKTNENYVTPENFKAITGWLEGVQFVAEFNTSTIEEIQSSLLEYTVAYIQVNSPQLIDELINSSIQVKLILKLSTENPHFTQTIEAYSDKVSYILLESENDSLPNINLPGAPIILGTGIKTENLEHILTTLHPLGIALKGSPEIRPGYKDFDELADILEALETDYDYE